MDLQIRQKVEMNSLRYDDVRIKSLTAEGNKGACKKGGKTTEEDRQMMEETGKHESCIQHWMNIGRFGLCLNWLLFSDLLQSSQ